MKNLIKEFVKEVTAHNNGFLLDCEGKHYLFTQASIGKAKLVYGEYVYNKDYISEAIGTKLGIKAVVCDGKVYIMDKHFFDLCPSRFDERDLPKHAALFYNAVKQVNKYAGEQLFSEFYEELEIEDVSAKSVKKMARDRLFSFNSKMAKTAHADIFTANDVIKFMSGSVEVEAEANQIFEKEREDWVKTKSENAKIAEMIANQEVAEIWEIDMAEGLRSIPDAKSVTVEFEFNGKIAAEKVVPETIMQMLRNNDYFSSYNFCNQKKGAILLKELDASHWCNDNKHLKCQHITKITYGNKEIYAKKEN